MATYDIRSSETVFDGRIMTVRVDQVEMPDGSVAAREVAAKTTAVAVVALDEQNRVALIEQYRHPLGHRLWELPAGLMDIDGEPALASAQRELAEETGLAATDWAVLVDLAVSPGFTTESIRVFLARGLTIGARAGEADAEELDLRLAWVDLDEAVLAVFDGHIVNASCVAGLLAAQRFLTDPLPLRPADSGWRDGPALESSPRPELTSDERW